MGSSGTGRSICAASPSVFRRAVLGLTHIGCNRAAYAPTYCEKMQEKGDDGQECAERVSARRIDGRRRHVVWKRCFCAGPHGVLHGEVSGLRANLTSTAQLVSSALGGSACPWPRGADRAGGPPFLLPDKHLRHAHLRRTPAWASATLLLGSRNSRLQVLVRHIAVNRPTKLTPYWSQNCTQKHESAISHSAGGRLL